MVGDQLISICFSGVGLRLCPQFLPPVYGCVLRVAATQKEPLCRNRWQPCQAQLLHPPLLCMSPFLSQQCTGVQCYEHVAWSTEQVHLSLFNEKLDSAYNLDNQSQRLQWCLYQSCHVFYSWTNILAELLVREGAVSSYSHICFKKCLLSLQLSLPRFVKLFSLYYQTPFPASTKEKKDKKKTPSRTIWTFPTERPWTRACSSPTLSLYNSPSKKGLDFSSTKPVHKGLDISMLKEQNGWKWPHKTDTFISQLVLVMSRESKWTKMSYN